MVIEAKGLGSWGLDAGANFCFPLPSSKQNHPNP